jgi:hypothetical protein
MYFTMHFTNGARHLYLYEHHSWPEIADDLFRGTLTARSVKGLLDEFIKKGQKINWAIGSAIALADFLKKNHNFQTEGYYDSTDKLQIYSVIYENEIIYD